jgi:uncharacterized metal-binding protein YceD (DUF177 family)
MPALTIPIHDLDTAGKDYVFALDEAWLAEHLSGTGVSGDTSGGPGLVEVHAQLNGREVLVHGRARACFLVECGRCLKGLPVEVSCDLAALYTEGAAPDDRDEDLDEIDPSEPDREFYTGDKLAIDALVRDYLLLELPMQASCDAGWACPNLDLPEHMRGPEGVSSSQSSGEEKIDPRLMPLMKLAANKPGERDDKPTGAGQTPTAGARKHKKKE